MLTPTPKKPSEYLKGLVTKESLSKLNKTIKEDIDITGDTAKQIFKWISELFTKFGDSVKEKGLQATLFGGPLMGLLNELSLGKKPSVKVAENKKSQTKKPETARDKAKELKIAKAKKKSKEEQNKIKKQVEQDQTKEIENLSIPDRIKWAIGEVIGMEVKGKHCWDWVEKAYANAGVRRKMIWNDIGKYTGKDCGEHHASADYLRNTLEYGYHLFVNTKKESNPDQYGNHSVIFLGWIDKNNLIARTASSPGRNKKTGEGRPGRIEERGWDLKKYPVTRVSKPVA